MKCKRISYFSSDPKVKVILVNVFGGIVNCVTIAKGIIVASRNLGLKIPLVVRLEGKIPQSPFFFFISLSLIVFTIYKSSKFYDLFMIICFHICVLVIRFINKFQIFFNDLFIS